MNRNQDDPRMVQRFLKQQAERAARAAASIRSKGETEKKPQQRKAPPMSREEFYERAFGVRFMMEPPPPRSREEELTRALEVATAKLREQDAVLKQLTEQPKSILVVLKKGSADGRWILRRGGELLEVGAPKELPILPGSAVMVLPQTMNIVSMSAAPPPTGDLVCVSHKVDANTCEVSIGIGSRAVLTGGHPVEVGDRVVLDQTYSVVVANLGPEPAKQVVATATGVTWEDIGGQVAAKEALREAIEGPIRHAELYRRYGRRPTKGVLLYGPPGNGKTMLGKAAATALAELHGATSRRSGFMYVKGPELLNMYVGATEQNIRQLFANALRHQQTHGHPAVVFIDEAEALLGRRGERDNVLSTTIVPMFLAEMDGLTESGAIVILATNRPDSLDPAVVREGRIDRKVRVGRPDREDARIVFQKHLAGSPISTAAHLTEIVEVGVSSLFAPEHQLYRVHRSEGLPKTVTLAHVTSGAQIAGICRKAVSLALERELAGGDEGVTSRDVTAAISMTLEEHRDLDHRDELAAFVEPFNGSVTKIERIRARLEGN